MKSWLSKLIAMVTTLVLCAGFACAQTTNSVEMNFQSVPALLKQAEGDGHHSTDSVIKLTFSLKLTHTAQLRTFLNNVQNPNSRQYHHWLTPTEAAAQFGPPPSGVAAVIKWLKSRGIEVLNVTPNRILIHTRAKTGAYEHALGIMINDYTLGGRTFFSTMDKPKLPASIGGFVQNVIGLNNAAVMHPMHKATRLSVRGQSAGVSPRVPAPPPQTSAYYRPQQIATAYDVPDITNPSNGAGVTTAILTADSSGLAGISDYNDFWAAFGLPPHATSVVEVDGNQGATDGLLETMLDMEWSGAWAPGESQIVYVAADPNLSTFIDMYSQFQTANAAQVMTTSWGTAEVNWGSIEATAESIFQLAATQGISMFAAAGDHGSGDNTGGDNACDYPSASLYITAASGTELHTNINGNWISEVGSADTGGAICTLPEPDWQTGLGVPANGFRNSGDMSLNYGSIWPYLVLQGGAWFGVQGTSAVAPQLAGMFADAVALNGSSLGQSNELLYNDVNAGNYATDFRDITSGSNGAYSAGPDWDHVTGWGSALAASLISHLGVQGPQGTVEGTVTDASTGDAIANVTVGFEPGNFSATTDSGGNYSKLLPAGDYTETASVLGYQPQSASVTVTDGGTTEQDFALVPSPNATLGGKVTDSGHGYPLYAEVVAKAGGQTVGDVWTNARSGNYKLTLPTGTEYTVTVTPYFSGYEPGTLTETLSGNTRKDFTLQPDSSCTAPGYSYQFGEAFNEDTFPPEGWTVTNDVFGSNVVWISTDQNTYNTGNFTGGTGNAADADSNAAATAVGSYDTSLITPPISTALMGQSPVLFFRENFQVFSGNEAFDVDISTDGGNSWTTIDHQTSACGGLYALPGCPETVDLDPYIQGEPTFQLRFRYYNLESDFDWYVQVDDVSIGICNPVAGGLVQGQVTDGNTKALLNGATVTDESGHSAETQTVGGQEGYLLFEATGDHMLTARDSNYQDKVKSVSVGDGSLKVVSFALNAGQFVVRPTQATLDVPVNTQQSYTLRIGNSGSAPLDWQLSSLNAPASSVRKAIKGSMPLIRVQGHFSPASLLARDENAQSHTRVSSAGYTMSPIQSTSTWSTVSDYPVPILDACSATDEVTGDVYTVGGVSDGVMISSGYVYDPTTQSWNPIANLPQPLQKPVCAMIAGKLYVTAGWESNYVDSNQTLYIYDPANDSWSEGPDDLVSVGGAASGVNLNGEFFVIGGCTTGSCSSLSAAVQVYDPASNSWSMATDYPQGIAWQGCGATKGKIYCAGGVIGTNIDTADVYFYDPSTDSWSVAAAMPYDNWAMAAIATSDGHLLLQDGVTGGFGAVTNQGSIYDVVTGHWDSLPNGIATVYRAASACGFYMIGGATGGFAGVQSAEILSGHNVCSAQAVPWLSFQPATGTLGIRRGTRSTVTINAGGQTAGTSSRVQIVVSGNTPYDDVVIPLVVNWISGS